VRYVNSLLKHKMLFGSDWPAITPDRWLADFEAIDIRKEEVRPLVLKENADQAARPTASHSGKKNPHRIADTRRARSCCRMPCIRAMMTSRGVPRIRSL
jgi:hypothetical protein